MREPLCYNCHWKPVPHIPYWECECGGNLNVFDEEGICPACKTKIEAVRCPKCAIIKSYNWWKGFNCIEIINAKVAEIVIPNACVTIQENATAWIKDRKSQISSNLSNSPSYNLQQSNLTDEQVNNCMLQIASGNGFSIHHPIVQISFPLLELVVHKLFGTITKSDVENNTFLQEVNIHEVNVHLKSDLSCIMYYCTTSVEHEPSKIK